MKKDPVEKMLKSLEVPTVEISRHKKNLKKELLASERFQKQNRSMFTQPLNLLKEVIQMFTPRKIMFVAPVLVAMLAVFVYMSATSLSKPVAYLTIEVNPALELSLNQNNEVVQMTSLNADAQAMVEKLDLKNKDFVEALKVITTELIAGGFVTPESKFVITLHPEQGNQADLSVLSDAAEIAVQQSLSAAGLNVEISSHVIPQELYNVAATDGVLPGSYVGLIEDGVQPELISQILALAETAGIDSAVALEEFYTLVSAMDDMIAAGMDEATALLVLSEAMKIDATLEELTTMTAAMIDAVETGIPVESGLAMLALFQTPGIAPELFREEVTTLFADMIDAHEAGISPEVTLALISQVLILDVGFEKISTVMAALIDLKNEGLSVDQAIQKILAAIQLDPTLATFDDLLYGTDDGGEGGQDDGGEGGQDDGGEGGQDDGGDDADDSGG